MTDKKKPTLDEAWALFHEVAAGFKDTNARIKELTASGKDTDARIKELAASGKDTDARIKELMASGKATDARVDKVAASVDRLASNVGGLGKRWGDLGEAMTIGGSLRIFNAIEGIKVYSLLISESSDEHDLEIDGLAIGKDMVIVIEAKATLRESDVEDFVNKKLKTLARLDSLCVGKKVYGAMGLLSASSAAQEQAQAQGLLLIRPTDTSKELVPFPPGFKLRNFQP